LLPVLAGGESSRRKCTPSIKASTEGGGGTAGHRHGGIVAAADPHPGAALDEALAHLGQQLELAHDPILMPSGARRGYPREA